VIYYQASRSITIMKKIYINILLCMLVYVVCAYQSAHPHPHPHMG